MHTLKACALSLALLPIASFADIDQTGKAHCQNFAAQQLKEIKQEHFATLTRDETNLALLVAERSCLTLYGDLEEEKETIRAEAAASSNKTPWWEKRKAEGHSVPGIKKAHQSGGK